jgi:hypothetical protein
MGHGKIVAENRKRQPRVQDTGHFRSHPLGGAGPTGLRNRGVWTTEIDVCKMRRPRPASHDGKPGQRSAVSRFSKKPTPVSRWAGYPVSGCNQRRRAASERSRSMKNIRFVGLECHAEMIAVAVAEPNGEVRPLGTIPNREESIRKLCASSVPQSSCESATRQALRDACCIGS